MKRTQKQVSSLNASYMTYCRAERLRRETLPPIKKRDRDPVVLRAEVKRIIHMRCSWY